MVDDVEGADAALAKLEVVDELSGSVDVGKRLSELAEQDIGETVTVHCGRTVDDLVECDSFQLQRRRNVLDDVVGTAPVAPRLVQVVQVAGSHERAEDVGCVRIRRSLWKKRSLAINECVQLTIAT